MVSVWSKRAPHPWDLEIDIGDGTGWHGLMLKPTQEGLLTGRLGEFLGQVSPTSYEYGASKPDEETTFVFGRLVGGMGEWVQSSATSKRYRYANAVDCSIGGMPRLGPLMVPATFPAVLGTDPSVRQFIVGPGEDPEDVGLPTPRALYCLRGQCVYRLEAGTWVLSHDFLGANKPLQAVVFQGTSGPARLVVTTSLGALWAYDGTNPWQQLDGAAGVVAWHCAVVGDELYVGGAETVRVTTDDALSVTGWGGPIRVGQGATRITYLAALSNTLFVFKADGVYTLNADGSDNDLFPELRPQQTGPGGFIPEFVPPGYAVNGLNATAWRDGLFFPFGDAYYRVTADGTLTPVGPERLIENTSPVRGLAVSGSGHADWFLYVGTWSVRTGNSFLWKYGTWSPTEGGGSPAAYRFDDVWNGSIVTWAGKHVTRVDVIHLDGEATLWAGFVDGSVESTPLPTGTPDPTMDPRCRFIDRGQLVWPLHDAVFGADRKAFHGVTVLGPTINANQSVRQYWRVDPALPYAALTPDLTANGQRVDFPDLTTGAARDVSTGLQLDTYTELRTTSSLLTPVLEGVALHEAVRPAAGDPVPRLSWTGTVRAGNRVVRRDGVVSRVTAEQILALCRAAATSAGHIRVRGPDGTISGMAAIEFVQSLAPENGRDGLEHDIGLRLVAFR